MIRVFLHENLGHVDHGWLNARHHFSFGSYFDLERKRFGLLRVVNDDRVAAGAGFEPHSHKDMEIITYVRQGAISHRDNAGNEGQTSAGDVQVMSAGSGIEHSEFNQGEVDVTLYQIWIYPDTQNVKPRWDTKAFPKEMVSGELALLVSGRKEDEGKNALYIQQDAAIYGGRMATGTTIAQPIKHQAYLLVSEGEIEVEGSKLKAGDGAEITNVQTLSIKALSDAEVVVIDVPAE